MELKRNSLLLTQKYNLKLSGLQEENVYKISNVQDKNVGRGLFPSLSIL